MGTFENEIMLSQQRCQAYGIDSTNGNSRDIVTGRSLTTLLASNQALIEAASPFMQKLYELVKSSGFVVVLVSQEGFIIEVVGDGESLSPEMGVHYVKGVKWTEEMVGTTAIGLVLKGNCSAIQVAGEQHYCRAFHGWSCSAAAIHDNNGTLFGVLSVTGPKKIVNCHTLGMVVAAATAVENMLKNRQSQKEMEKSSQITSTIVNAISDGLLMLDKTGSVTYINPIGAKILKVNAQEVIGKNIRDIVDFKPVVLQVLETGQGYQDRECVIETKRGTLHFIKTAIPLYDEHGQFDGVIDIFREIKRVRQMVNRMVGATAKFCFDDLIGNSVGILETVRMAKIAANSRANVLIQGESGTGKELIAQAIHNSSARYDGPFVAINCGALPRDLVESELFGYEEGAFTGAKSGGRPGKFELAQGGTLFLDEIGEMPLDIQVKILRVLQDKRLSRVGGMRYLDIDVRIICATNRDLGYEVSQGNFRQDLFYRLNVFPIFVPPLRERQGDVVVLAEKILDKLCDQMGVEKKELSPALRVALQDYDWPGNVRELENIIERAVNICQEQLIGPEYLPVAIMGSPVQTLRHKMSLKEIELKAIRETLEETKGNISQAAELLGIGRNTLYSKLKEQPR
ncbi:sigma-54-dependent Fis family transcriptional regulator [Sporomusaceae bacterium FL31]|nr:sigma-54-dependent Fis family transcriptional regulator [Sporomusaceae bacterium FL31]GCE34635.1 sigma-54-dependent Fis family transcriptional regulator [Sporomusaceae bacterium]